MNDATVTVSLPIETAWQRSKLVATVTITALGQPTWNTPDGAGPTLAEIRSAHQQGGAVGGFYPVAPLTLRTVRVWKADALGVPSTLWMPGGRPPPSSEGLESTVAEARFPEAGETIIFFWGDAFNLRNGQGPALPSRVLLQRCTVAADSASCSGFTMSARSLDSTLSSLADGRSSNPRRPQRVFLDTRSGERHDRRSPRSSRGGQFSA